MKIKRVEHVAIAVQSLGPVHRPAAEHVRAGARVRGADRPDPPRHAAGRRDLHRAARGPGARVRRDQWITDHGPGLFHICFEVEDIDGALAELKAKGVKLRDETPRIGHGGARIAFIDPSATGNVLIELAELPAGHGASA